VTNPGRHADGGNLYLRVDRSGAKRWVFFYRLNGRQREAVLGGIHSNSLAKARKLKPIANGPQRSRCSRSPKFRRL
jgi:hypothetical protein